MLFKEFIVELEAFSRITFSWTSYVTAFDPAKCPCNCFWSHFLPVFAVLAVAKLKFFFFHPCSLLLSPPIRGVSVQGQRNHSCVCCKYIFDALWLASINFGTSTDLRRMDHSSNRHQTIAIWENFEVVYHQDFGHSNSDAYFEVFVFLYLKDVDQKYPIKRQ